MKKLWRRIYFILHRTRLERELAEEMQLHLEMMPPSPHSTFGNVTRLREESREVWFSIWLQQFWQDLCYGVRVLWGAPGFTLGAVAVLALGIGANLAEFQIFDAMIFHRLTIRDATSLLQLSRDSKQGERLGFSPAAVEFYRAESSSFAWLVSEDASVQVTVEGDTGLRSNFVSATYFSSLGIAPSWGRLFGALDAQPVRRQSPYWAMDIGKRVGVPTHMSLAASYMSTVTPYKLWAYCLTILIAWRPLGLPFGSPFPSARC